MPPIRTDQLPAATRIFVDREEPQKIFMNAAFAIPDNSVIIRVFYGAGGQGKTALCRELMRKTDRAVDPSYSFLRRACLDLHDKPKTDPDLLLVWIRNEFAKAGLSLPCFDLALALVWEGTRGEQPFPSLVSPWLGRSSKAAEGTIDEATNWLGSDTAKELIGEAIGEIPGLGFVFRRIGKWTIEKGKKIYLEQTREYLQELYRDDNLRPAFELSKLLPWMLAQDLNHHLKENPSDRFVLFIDEYERVFDQGGAGAVWTDSPFDRHVRDFLKETNGLLAVFFSRESLPWAKEADWQDDLLNNQHSLSGLADKDADTFLKAIPIDDEHIRTAIIDGARETSGPNAPVYPLMLDLQVEHWRALSAKNMALPESFVVSAETFEGRCREIVGRVLRDYDAGIQTTLERLSVAKRFDRAAFDFVVTKFGTAVPLDSFDQISELSFVTRSSEGFLSFHKVIASVVEQLLTDEKRKSSVDALFEHYWSRAKVGTHFDLDAGKIAALFEASYLKRKQETSDYVLWLEDSTVPLKKAALYEPSRALWLEAVAIHETVHGPEHPSTGRSLNNLAGLLQHMGDYAAAKPLFERALAISEKAHGPEHILTGRYLNNLASLHHNMGDYAAAKPLYERSLAIREKTEGPEHPSTATTLNNLASLFRDMGNYTGAKPLYERALAISEKVYGPEHPFTGRSLNGLAGLLHHLGDYAGAKPLYERALAISEKDEGPEHPSTATTLNNLASLFLDLGDYGGAKPLFERALAISEKVYGPEHPFTGASLNNLASLFRDVGNYAGAKALYKRALAISEKVYGPEHPLTGASLNNLGSLFRDMGNYAGAKALFERALAISEKAEGLEHPSTGIHLNNLAGLFRDMGDYAGAKLLYERALEINVKAHGTEHPSLATSLNGLASLLHDKGDYAGAKTLFERALQISEKAQGPEHSSTATSLNNLARLLHDMGDYAAAKPLFERALQISEKAFGPEHPSTGTYLNNLAGLLLDMGDYAGAKPLFERALAISEKVYGPEHPSTAACLNNLAGLLRDIGDYAGAKLLYERALAISEKAEGPEHLTTGKRLNNLAGLFMGMGNYPAAKPLYVRALTIFERELGPTHPYSVYICKILADFPQ
ncbi:tetratricopeptide repeat protein [Agrobacterium vitis]